MRKILSSLPLVVLAVVVGLISFTATAFAAGTADPTGDGTTLLEMARPVFDAVMHGQWWLAASLALVFVVAVVGKYGDKAPGPVGKWLARFDGSDAGRATLVLLGSFGGAVATGLAAVGTGAMTWALAWTALKVAVGASGIYSLGRKLLAPLVGKAPAWLQPLLWVVLWAFDRKAGAPAADAVAEAEAAGDAAVTAHPAPGVESVVGKPRDVR